MHLKNAFTHNDKDGIFYRNSEKSLTKIEQKISRGQGVTSQQEVDLLAILKKSLDRALFLYNFIRELRSSGVRASIKGLSSFSYFWDSSALC